MRFLLSLLLSFFVAWLTPTQTNAQRLYRIGAAVSEDFFLPAFEGFKAKMAEMGYVERKNVQYELRNAKGDQDALRKLAQKLVQDKPDLIVTSSTPATLPVAKASEGTHIPVVFLSAGNPLLLVKSYASSGNNLTGISTAVLDLTAKRLELLKDIDPRVKRVASLNNPKGANYKENLVAVRDAAKKLGLELWEINIKDKEEIERVSRTLTRKAVDAVFLAPDRLITGNIEVLVRQSIKEKLPLIPPPAAYNTGGLATYGHDYYSLGQQGAVLVDKVLKGAKPSDLPIEQPLKLKLFINLKTAKAIGLKIPRGILLRADEVIE